MNNIKVILTCKLLYAKALKKYSSEHIKDFYFMIDDYYSKEFVEIEKELKGFCKGFFYSSDVYKFLSDDLNIKGKIPSEIIKYYPPSIKTVMPLYFRSKGYDKFIYLDDDIIITANIDHWFDLSSAKYKETISMVKENEMKSLSKWCDIGCEEFKKNCLINSGHFMMPLNFDYDRYLTYLHQYFNNEIKVSRLKRSFEKGFHSFDWMYEQRFLGFIFYKLFDNTSLLNKDCYLAYMRNMKVAYIIKRKVIHFPLGSKTKAMVYARLDDIMNARVETLGEIITETFEIDGIIFTNKLDAGLYLGGETNKTREDIVEILDTTEKMADFYLTKRKKHSKLKSFVK